MAWQRNCRDPGGSILRLGREVRVARVVLTLRVRVEQLDALLPDVIILELHGGGDLEERVSRRREQRRWRV